MGLDLLKAGWPNMAAVACLALMPLVSLTIPGKSNGMHSVVNTSEQVLVAGDSMIGGPEDDNGQF